MSYSPTGKVVSTIPADLSGLTKSSKTEAKSSDGLSFANLVGELDRAGKKAEDATYRSGSEKDLIALSEAVNEFDTAFTVAEAVLKKATNTYKEIEKILG